jgi:hypothetical protein
LQEMAAAPECHTTLPELNSICCPHAATIFAIAHAHFLRRNPGGAFRLYPASDRAHNRLHRDA